jgi:hypothetical protein
MLLQYKLTKCLTISLFHMYCFTVVTFVSVVFHGQFSSFCSLQICSLLWLSPITFVGILVVLDVLHSVLNIIWDLQENAIECLLMNYYTLHK